MTNRVDREVLVVLDCQHHHSCQYHLLDLGSQAVHPAQICQGLLSYRCHPEDPAHQDFLANRYRLSVRDCPCSQQVPAVQTVQLSRLHPADQGFHVLLSAQVSRVGPLVLDCLQNPFHL